MKDEIIREICRVLSNLPASQWRTSVSARHFLRSNPSSPGYSPNPRSPLPALLETQVRFWMSLFSLMALMSVSGVPHSPKPDDKTVSPDLMLFTASSAETIFEGSDDEEAWRCCIVTMEKDGCVGVRRATGARGAERLTLKSDLSMVDVSYGTAVRGKREQQGPLSSFLPWLLLSLKRRAPARLHFPAFRRFFRNTRGLPRTPLLSSCPPCPPCMQSRQTRQGTASGHALVGRDRVLFYSVQCGEGYHFGANWGHDTTQHDT